MTKKEFLAELKQSLSVLEQAEQTDIVDEYEQHIDMKMKGGLTEEEAIDDFGSVKSLSAEILEAYHVRADYSMDVGTQQPQGKSFGGGVKEMVTSTKQKLTKGIKRVGSITKEGKKGKVTRPEEAVLSVEETAAETVTCGPSVMRETVETKAIRNRDIRTGAVQKIKLWTKLWTKLRKGLGRVFQFCGEVIRWCVRLGWNLCWISLGAAIGLMGLFALFFTGMLTVILTQGYPLIGVTIAGFGATCCLAAATGLSLSVICHLKKPQQKVSDTELVENVEDKGEVVCAD